MQLIDSNLQEIQKAARCTLGLKSILMAAKIISQEEFENLVS